MTPEQIALVGASFDLVGTDLPELATQFYKELFRLDPGLRAMFTTDQAEQEILFSAQLTEIVHSIPNLDELLTRTHALGARHAGYGVRAAGYQTVGAALLGALSSVLGDSFDAETRAAWVFAYSLIAETMQEGATSARTIGE